MPLQKDVSTRRSKAGSFPAAFLQHWQCAIFRPISIPSFHPMCRGSSSWRHLPIPEILHWYNGKKSDGLPENADHGMWNAHLFAFPLLVPEVSCAFLGTDLKHPLAVEFHVFRYRQLAFASMLCGINPFSGLGLKPH